MPAKSTSIVINALGGTDGKTKVKNTISYVNPAISDSVALELGQRVSALTKDSYQTTDRVDTTELDNDTRSDYPAPQIKGIRTTGGAPAYIAITDDNKASLIVNQNCFVLNQSSQTIEFLWPSIDVKSNQAPYFITDDPNLKATTRNEIIGSRWQIFLGGWEEKPAVGTVINATLCMDGNATYKAAEWDLTITVSE